MLNPDYHDILSAFGDADVEYLVVGAYAMAAHGHPRATGDLDLWIRRSPQNAKRVFHAVDTFGAPLHDVEESDFTTPELVFQIGVEPRRVDILTSIDGVTFEEAWAARFIIEIEGLSIPVLSRHHLIQNKRAVGRPQDQADVARLESIDEDGPSE
ncbi:MAG: nucleotidyltransferase [Salinibacter sp.]